MREIAEKSVGWLVLAGIVLAIVVAKRRSENKFAAAVAAARAEGHAEAVSGAAATSNVNVAVGASNGGPALHQCDDLYSCAVCAPIALRILMDSGRSSAGVERASIGSATRLHDYDHDYDSSSDDAAVVRTARSGVGDDGGSGASGRGPGGNARRADGVEVAPCASVNESSRLSDLLARPWAYDEADPRCEVKRA